MLRTMGNLIYKISFLEGVRSVRGPVITVQLERMNFPAASSMNWKEVARVCIFDCESPWWGRGRSRYDSTKVLAKCFTTLCHIHFLFKGLCSFPKDNTAVRHVILEPLCFQFLFFFLICFPASGWLKVKCSPFDTLSFESPDPSHPSNLFSPLIRTQETVLAYAEVPDLLLVSPLQLRVEESGKS